MDEREALYIDRVFINRNYAGGILTDKIFHWLSNKSQMGIRPVINDIL